MKNLLYTLLLIGSVSFGQQTPASCLEKAKPYLAKDACNGTGIAWVKGALKLDPDNAEAERLLKKCADGEINEAMATLRQDPDNITAISVLHRYEEKYPSEELYYLLAKRYSLETGNHVSKKYINKALSYNPNNLDYRYIRFKCNFLDDSRVDDLQEAINDLNFLIENGFEPARMYANLSIAQNEIGNQLKDKDSKLKYYKESIISAEKAISLNPEFKDKLNINLARKDLAKLEQS